MTAITKASAKALFMTGDRPSQQDFADLIDSYQDAAANLGTLTSAALGTVGLQILSCTTSASAASIVGVPTAGTVGAIIYATNTTAAAQDTLGVGTVGRQIFEAATTAQVQNIVGASITFSGALVTKSGNQSIPNNSLTTVTWDQEVYDTDAFHDNATNNPSFTIPAAANNRKAIFYFGGAWQVGTTGYRYALLTKNSAATTNPTFQNSVTPVTGTDTQHSMQTAPITVSAGDTYQIAVQQTIGSAHPFNAAGSYFGIQVIS